MDSWFWFLLLTVVCIAVQGFFSMFEMAVVSFNKVRLQYFASKNSQRAIRLQELLSNPSALFGTTLIGVNTALQLGSECSRRFYESLHLSMDFAPITQIIIVLIFAELAPIFEARRHPEQVAMGGAYIIYTISRILTPVIYLIKFISTGSNKLFGGAKETGIFLSREELEKAFEEKEVRTLSEGEDINRVASNIFALKEKRVKDMMLPLSEIATVAFDASLRDLQRILGVRYAPFVPIYQGAPHNIVAIAYPRDLLRLEDSTKIAGHAKSPWFIFEADPVSQILKQFRHNRQSIAIVLGKNGIAAGILTLDQIIDEIFPSDTHVISYRQKTHMECSLPGDMPIEEFNRRFNAALDAKKGKTLSDLICANLNHLPTEGEAAYIDRFELMVEEASLLGVKTVLVRTIV